MIIIKWLTDWEKIGTEKAPSIINLLIDTFIKLGDVHPKLYGIEGEQKVVHKFILAIFIICCLTMMIPKPIIEYLNIKKEKKEKKDKYFHHDHEKINNNQIQNDSKYFKTKRNRNYKKT
jgi:hypothetical protein